MKRKETPIDEEALSIPDVKVESLFSNLWLKDALNSLTQQQRNRVVEKYILGFFEKQIAEYEGVNQANGTQFFEVNKAANTREEAVDEWEKRYGSPNSEIIWVKKNY